MSSGLHREPSVLSNKIGLFDQEMRRRLWFTILELEVHCACDRGIPSWIEWDCLPPLNIEDEDFSPETESLPLSKPASVFTRTSFLSNAARHVSLRLEILNKINSISHSLQYDVVMHYDARIRQLLDEVPEWPKNGRTVVAQAVSQLVLYELILLMHQAFATQELAQSRLFYSRCARRNTSLIIMKMYSEIPRSHALTLVNIRDTVFRACLATCHDIIVAGNATDDLMQDKYMAVDLMQKTVELIELRVKTLGLGFHGFWVCSSALSLVRSRASPELSLDIFAQEAADRVVRLHNEMMGSQQPQDIDPFQPPGDNETTAIFSGFTPIPDPFNDSIFDFVSLAEVWNINGFGLYDTIG